MSRRAAGSSIPVGDKGLARLGDAFINLAFSYAKTKVKGKPFGEKVPDRVLSQALELAKIPVATRLKHGQRGDMVESIIAYSWLSGLIGLEEATMVIASELSASDAISESRGLEREAAAKAFSRLVVLCVARVEKEGGAYWV